MNMLERMARAIDPNAFVAFDSGYVRGEHMEPVFDHTLAALKAMRDPTPEMLHAGESDLRCNRDATPLSVYQAMIDAAIGDKIG
jgi:hypothetical protein